MSALHRFRKPPVIEGQSLGARVGSYVGKASSLSSIIALARALACSMACVMACVMTWVLTWPAAVSADEAVLIAGGPDPASSPEDVELTALWIENILDTAGLPLTTFFTDGESIGPDVYFKVSQDTAESPLMPLARLFGDDVVERRRYRENELPELAGGTRRDLLEPLFENLLERTRDEPLLLIYNGQGSRSGERHAADASLDLWGNTTLRASELHALIEKRRPRAREPFRYLFTQCHSGGFHRLAYQDANTGIELAAATRCGFTAESAWQRSESCSARADDHEQSSYSTFFLAALDDRERDGSVLTRNPDVDADGDVSLREAHFHALELAHSTDFARSTSEDWLERWQPWYLRWLPVSSHLPNNEYARLFRSLATRTGLPLDNRVGQTLRERLSTHRKELDALRVERDSREQSLEASRLDLQREATRRWQALRAPYTSAYRTLAMGNELIDIAAWIARQPDYAELVEHLGVLSRLELQILGRERDITAVHKLLRLRRLADLKGQLAEHGKPHEQASYARLLDCEELPLAMGRAIPADEARDISAESALE